MLNWTSEILADPELGLGQVAEIVAKQMEVTGVKGTCRVSILKGDGSHNNSVVSSSFSTEIIVKDEEGNRYNTMGLVAGKEARGWREAGGDKGLSSDDVLAGESPYFGWSSFSLTPTHILIATYSGGKEDQDIAAACEAVRLAERRLDFLRNKHQNNLTS